MESRSVDRRPAPRRPVRRLRPGRRQLASLLLAACAALSIAVGASGVASAGGTVHVAKRHFVRSLKRTVLANLKGRTLYSLGAEKHGRFICTDSACVALWRPLVVASGKAPIGPVPLGTVTRPNRKVQVTYRGRPLYTFKGDTRAGTAKGQGFKDVGTWHAAVLPKR